MSNFKVCAAVAVALLCGPASAHIIDVVYRGTASGIDVVGAFGTPGWVFSDAPTAVAFTFNDKTPGVTIYFNETTLTGYSHSSPGSATVTVDGIKLGVPGNNFSYLSVYNTGSGFGQADIGGQVSYQVPGAIYYVNAILYGNPTSFSQNLLSGFTYTFDPAGVYSRGNGNIEAQYIPFGPRTDLNFRPTSVKLSVLANVPEPSQLPFIIISSGLLMLSRSLRRRVDRVSRRTLA